MRAQVVKKSLLGVALAISTLVLSACGTASQIYATDKTDGVYFTVPHGWFTLAQSSLSAREAQSTVSGAADRLANVHWQEAFSPKSITATEVFSLLSNPQPTVYVRVRTLLPDEANSFSR